MALGASFAGVRAMTASSGGGFALMVEGLSLAAMTETPIVIGLGQRPGLQQASLHELSRENCSLLCTQLMVNSEDHLCAGDPSRPSILLTRPLTFQRNTGAGICDL